MFVHISNKNTMRKNYPKIAKLTATLLIFALVIGTLPLSVITAAASNTNFNHFLDDDFYSSEISIIEETNPIDENINENFETNEVSDTTEYNDEILDEYDLGEIIEIVNSEPIDDLDNEVTRIISFIELTKEQRVISVPFGTEKDTLEFPAYLVAVVASEADELEHIEIPVNWESIYPYFDGEVIASYLFRATLYWDVAYHYAYGVLPPDIIVMVDPVEIVPLGDNVTGTFNIDTARWTTPGTNNDVAWDADGQTLTLGAGSNVTVTGNTTQDNRRIVISGGSVNLTLDNAGVQGSQADGTSSIALQGNANVTLTVVGTNNIINNNTTLSTQNFENHFIGGAGIHVPVGTTINIIGTGTLNAQGSGPSLTGDDNWGIGLGGGGAGIGGTTGMNQEERSAGNITIEERVTVNAIGRSSGAGIGGGGATDPTGAAGNSGNITIQGGANVLAVSQLRGAGIGGGANIVSDHGGAGNGQNITINTTGRVFARGGYTGGAGIGGGSGGQAVNGGNGGTININGGQITAIGGLGTVPAHFGAHNLAQSIGGAGIGGSSGTGEAGNSGDITITGGTVRASSQNPLAAGIGGGGGPNGLMETINVTGGNVASPSTTSQKSTFMLIRFVMLAAI